jgi:phosphoribosyl 1,2-cyclic phosphodiesterase
MTITTKFWGVRGSIPTPLTPAQVTAKMKRAYALGMMNADLAKQSFEDLSTYGGNTTCVEVNCGDQLFILDMGTGVRELGNHQMKQLTATKTLKGTILQSHVHWDHIQGLPFWKPLYMPRKIFQCDFQFFGGKQWDSELDRVYRGQMNAPVFPVNLEELEQTAMNMTFNSVFDGWERVFNNPRDLADPGVKVTARKLFHPQDTFGYRIESKGKSIAFTTDHEPYRGGTPRGLLELVQGVDEWVTDCQFTEHEYTGKKGPARYNWGHSFPEYIAEVAREAQPKKVVTTHHDPEADDLHITAIALQVQALCQIETVAAYEGLEITV